MGSYSLVLVKFDGAVKTERVIIPRGTFDRCLARREALEETVRFLDEHNYTADFRWVRKNPLPNSDIYPWAEFQIRRA